MAQIFHPSFNTVSKVSIFGSVFILAAAAWAWAELLRSPYVTQAETAREQPVMFSHKHHVAGLGIDCRFCHWPVENSPFAGIPPTKTCMGCHSLVWTDAPILEPVRESYRTDRPLAWTRVHDLPDFTYFDHSIHVAKGVGCSECHGPVDEMQLVWSPHALHMEFCLDCHREPEPRLRPRARIFDSDWDHEKLSPDERAALAEEYEVRSLIYCSVCHR